VARHGQSELHITHGLTILVTALPVRYELVSPAHLLSHSWRPVSVEHVFTQHTHTHIEFATQLKPPTDMCATTVVAVASR
jgi:hypothetical protein